jgi:O-antigen/teichoic acid export membrane protein
VNRLRQRTVAGLGWSGANQVIGQLLQLVFSITLARMLSPAEFGLVGMIVVFTGFASNIADLGLGASLIQRPSISESHLNAVFWLNVAMGALLTLLLSAAAPIIAGFYGDPRLQLLTMAVAGTVLLGSLSAVQGALLSKSIDFRRRFLVDIVATAVSGTVAVGLALAGAGVWSLVAQSLALPAVRSGLLWWGTPWRPRWSLEMTAVKDLRRWARHMTLFNIVIYWENNFEKMAIGRLLGSAPLGIYNVAERIMRIPSTNVTATASNVMFPAVSLIQQDIESVRRVYLKSNRLIAAATFPAMVGLMMLAEPTILALLGPKWRSSIVLLQLLCLAGLAQSAYNTAGWIYLSYGRPDLLLRASLFAFAARVAGVFIGLPWGIVGVVSAYVVGVYACVLYTTWSPAGRLIGLRVIEVMRNLAEPLFCAAGMGLVVCATDWWLREAQADWVRLTVGVPVGVISYSVLVRLFWIGGWHEIEDLLRGQAQRDAVTDGGPPIAGPSPATAIRSKE